MSHRFKEVSKIKKKIKVKLSHYGLPDVKGKKNIAPTHSSPQL
jgi:hypothetical protein